MLAAAGGSVKVAVDGNALLAAVQQKSSVQAHKLEVHHTEMQRSAANH
jgi:hypothetical protein